MTNAVPTKPGAALSADGRHARRERGQAAVVDALFSLLSEGTYYPPIELVAERAGVSASSVFRYFDGVDELHRRTIDRYFEVFAPLFALNEIGVGTLTQRIDRFVDARLALYQAIAPLARLARARALDTPLLAEKLSETRDLFASQAGQHFATELQSESTASQSDLLSLIDSLTSFEAWDLLGVAHDRSQSQRRRAWRRGLNALLS